MRIRTRTLVLIGGMTVGLLAIVYAISAFLFLGRFARLERREALRGLEQARNALANELDEMSVFNHDWAAWDDTYAFVQDANPEYLESNLMDETFTGARLNLMMFLNREGKPVFAKSYDWRGGARLRRSGAAVAAPAAGQPPGAPHRRRRAYQRHPAASRGAAPGRRPPHPDQHLAGPQPRHPGHGAVPGRPELAGLAEQTRLDLRLIRLDQEQLEELPDESRAALALQGELVRPLDGQRIAAYALLSDVYGQTALVLRSVIPREIYRQGLSGARYLILSLLLAGLAYGAVIIFLLEGTVLHRLSGLSREVSGIGLRRDLSARVAVNGNDELTALGSSINAMLAELQNTAETHQALTGAIPDLILRVSESGRLLDANRFGDPLLAPAGPSAEPQDLARRLPASLAERSLQEMRAAMASGRLRIFEHRQESADGFRDFEVRILAIASGEALVDHPRRDRAQAFGGAGQEGAAPAGDPPPGKEQPAGDLQPAVPAEPAGRRPAPGRHPGGEPPPYPFHRPDPREALPVRGPQ